MCLSSNKGAKSAAAASAAQNAALVAQAQQTAAQQAADQKAAYEALLAETKAQGDKTLAASQAQQAALLTALGDQKSSFAASQKDLLEQQKKMAADAAERADNAIKWSGQKAKSPSILKRWGENAAATRGGVSSTMLTGSAGVSTGNLSLGRASLLGA